MAKTKRLKLIIFAIFVAAVLFVTACAFSACSGQSVRHVTLDEHEIVITENSTYVLNADVRTGTSGSYTGLVVWESSDEEVATVSSGIVTAVAPGHATITVTAKGTDVYDSCAVTVTTTETLRVGVKDDVDNFGKKNPNLRTYEGMEIDLAQKMATELLYADVKYTTVTSADRIQKLNDDEVDCVIATFSITDERREQVNFSSPYYTDYVQILVTDDFVGKYGTSVSDFSDWTADYRSVYDTNQKTKIGYVSSTTAYDAFTEYCRNADIVVSDKNGDYFEPVAYDDYASCEQALYEGDIAMFVGDHSILSSYAVSGMVFLDDMFGAQNYGIATKKEKSGEGLAGVGDDLTELGRQINELIDLWIDDGTLDEFLAEYGLVRYVDDSAGESDET